MRVVHLSAETGKVIVVHQVWNPQDITVVYNPLPSNLPRSPVPIDSASLLRVSSFIICFRLVFVFGDGHLVSKEWIFLSFFPFHFLLLSMHISGVGVPMDPISAHYFFFLYLEKVRMEGTRDDGCC